MTNQDRILLKKEYGVPKNEQTRCPKMDPIMNRRISANVKSKDTEISKLQAQNLDAVGPLAYLLELCSKDNPTIGLSDVKKAVKSVLRLVGNASCHAPRLRRKNVLVDMNNDLTDYADNDYNFKDAAPPIVWKGV